MELRKVEKKEDGKRQMPYDSIYMRHLEYSVSETEGRKWLPRAGEGGRMETYCSVGAEFQFYKTEGVLEMVVIAAQYYECT